jgi:translation elongation factor EF-1beta
MGEVIALIRLMPDGVITDKDMDFITEEVKKVVQKPARLGRVEVKEIAFGLRGLDVTIAVPDVEVVLIRLSKTREERNDNVDAVDVGRI